MASLKIGAFTHRPEKRAWRGAQAAEFRTLHIAVFSYGLPTPQQKRGGIERVAHELADALGRRGHQVTVWTYDERPESAAYVTRKLPLEPVFRTWLGQRLTMGYLGNLLALVPDYRRCDVIMSHGDSLLLPMVGKPIVRVMHGSALGEALSAKSILRAVGQLGVYVQELFTALLQPGCVANSHGARRYNPFIRRVISLGVDLSKFYPDKSAKTPQPSVLFVGALDGRKRGHLLLRWFAETVRRRHPLASLMMVCRPGPATDGVTYHTGVSDAELATLYRRAWVYASPSVYEGFGLPYVEAMASGTPVVASPNPGSREVLDDGRCGLLVDDVDFGRAIADLLADDARYRELQAAGLAQARRFAIDTVAEAYEELLLEFCGHTGKEMRG